jgi:virulence-associated protein VapD
MRTAMARHRLRQVAQTTRLETPAPHVSNLPQWGKRVYAICFDLDTETLKNQYHNESWTNAYQEIGRILATHGFRPQQGSVYFGDEKVDPVKCVLAIQDIVRACPWFRMAVKDVRMLRIEENNDLMPAVGEPELPLQPTPLIAAE